MFLAAQLIGLGILSQYLDMPLSQSTGKTVTNNETYSAAGMTPPTELTWWEIFIVIPGSILVGTSAVLLLIKFKKTNLWKLWYMFAVLFGLSYALSPWLSKAIVKLGLVSSTPYIVYFISGILSYFKVYKPNPFLHNLTEILLYGGIAAILVPMIPSIAVISAILILISLYDAYAVWKSKHMVKLAEFQKKSRVFAGLALPYKQLRIKTKKRKKHKEKTKRAKIKSAILGGGDIAFPLLFSGVVMKSIQNSYAPFITTITAGIALAILLMKTKKNRYYPAMPFISAGCFTGLFIVLIIS